MALDRAPGGDQDRSVVGYRGSYADLDRAHPPGTRRSRSSALCPGRRSTPSSSAALTQTHGPATSVTACFPWVAGTQVVYPSA
jgi:hypothetical protein